MTASIENAERRPRAGHTFAASRPNSTLSWEDPGRAKTRTGKISNERLYGPEGVDINPFRETPARETVDVRDVHRLLKRTIYGSD